MSNDKHETLVDRALRTGYMKTAGRLVLYLSLTITQFLVLFAVSESNPEAAAELADAMTVAIGPFNIDALVFLSRLLAIWVFAPMVFQAADDVRKVMASA